MLRELSAVLEEIHDALVDSTTLARAGMRVERAEIALPMDVVPIFRDGGCVVLADVTRNYADDAWIDRPSQLRVHWHAVPLEEQR
jgi:hypothetical protein